MEIKASATLVVLVPEDSQEICKDAIQHALGPTCQVFRSQDGALIDVERGIRAVGDMYGLTARHRDVLRGVVEHLTNNEIARKCDISPRTVKSHLEAICERTGTHGRGNLAELVYRHAVTRPAPVEPAPPKLRRVR